MIWLNGILLPEPSGLDIGIHDITRSERSSSGRMSQEFIARKRTVSIEYERIIGTDIDAVLANLESRVFHTLRYPDPRGGERTITAYVGDRAMGAFYTIGGARWWQGVKFTMIEQ